MKDGFNGQITREDQLVRTSSRPRSHARERRDRADRRARCRAGRLARRRASSRSAPAASGVAPRDPGLRPAAPARPERPRTKLFRGRRRHHPHERPDLVPDPADARRDGLATGGEEVLNGFAGEHGGNLDNHLHGPGARIYLPVRQPGGMFAIGDMHASHGRWRDLAAPASRSRARSTSASGCVKGRQGTLARDGARRTTGSPTAPRRATCASAVELASEEAARLLVDQWGFSLEEAFIFLSVACDVGIAQACQPSPFSSIARVMIPKITACPQPFAD